MLGVFGYLEFAIQKEKQFMNLVKKYWVIILVLLAFGIHFLVIQPLKDKYDLIFYLELDLMQEQNGSIKKIDHEKYCALLEDISNSKHQSCEDNLIYWRNEYAKDRIRINSGLKPKNKFSKTKQNLKEKIAVTEWIYWGLMFSAILLLFIRRRK